MGFFTKLFRSKLTPEELMDESAKICEEAFVDAAKKTLEKTSDDLARLLSIILPGLSSVLAANFALELIKGILTLLVSKEYVSEVNRSLRTLLSNPMRTGIDQLQIALKLSSDHPVSTIEQTTYIRERFKDSLRNFDQALSNAIDREKGPIHLYRAIASMHIPGGEAEARIHLARFSECCESRVKLMEAEAIAEESQARDDAQKAEKIKIGCAGLGGGLVGMDQSQTILKKRTFEESSNEHSLRVAQLRAQELKLQNCIVMAKFLASRAQ